MRGIVTAVVLAIILGAAGPSGAGAAPVGLSAPSHAHSRVPSGAEVAAPARRAVVGVIRAGGQRQYISCRGTGGPTTVLVAGLWGWSKDWADLVGPWRRAGRVCTYDRPGLGRSPGRTGSRTVNAGTHAKELRALLRAVGETGQVILVGHSYGGLISRAYLKRYPKGVAGVLLLDAVPAGMESDFPGYGRAWEEAGSTVSLADSSRATGYDRPLTGVPLVVVAAGDAITWAPQAAEVWNRGQDRAAQASGRSIRLTARGAAHMLQQTAPAVVDRAMRVLRTGLRRGTFRPGCHLDWDSLGADCFDLNGR